MEGESNFSFIAPPTFDGDNYPVWAVRVETYMEVVDTWEAVEDDYEIPPLPTNPIVLQKMKETKTIKEYFDRLVSIPNKVRLLGSSLADSRIVKKILVTIAERFEATFSTLENTKDMSKKTLSELLSALQAQEQRHVMRQEGAIEGALPVKHQDDGKIRRPKNKRPLAISQGIVVVEVVVGLSMVAEHVVLIMEEAMTGEVGDMT
ncbi:hypothetical protein GQ457_05G026480 [Hibiscus cannabinus]